MALNHITKFDLFHTNASKGVSLILLLWHHLFYRHLEYGMLIKETADIAKVCVAIFILLSGYGLSESIKNRKIGLFEFYKNRLIKLYLNYWFIIAIFVPIGIFFMDRSLSSVFGSHEYIKLLIQISGFHMYFSIGYGYNATWWFMSLIISLYLLFPLLYVLVKRFRLWSIVFALVVLWIPYRYFGSFVIIQKWLLPFILGIYISRVNGFTIILTYLQRVGIMRFIILILFLIIFAFLREYGNIYTEYGYFVRGVRIVDH